MNNKKSKPGIASHSSFYKKTNFNYFNKNKGKITTKLIKKIKEKNSIKNIFLPLAKNIKENISKNKETNNFNNKSNPNCQTQNNLDIYQNISYSNNSLSLPKINNKKGKNMSLSRDYLNHLNFLYNFASPNVYRQIIAKYKSNLNYNSKINNDRDLNDSSYMEGCKTLILNNNIEKAENKINNNVITVTKKENLRNKFCNDSFQNEEFKSLLNKIKGKEINSKNEIKKMNKDDKISLFIKFKNNNINRRNTHINNFKKSETFDKSLDSEEIKTRIKNNNEIFNPSENKKIMKNNILTNKKNSFKSLNNKSNLSNKIPSYKTFFNQKISPKRKKNNNDDIINLLNID